jgi:5,10-methylenetetrahydromethanopterin reductase
MAGLARRAEAARFDEVWVVEDCFYAGAIATAGAVLAATETITVGIGVLPTVLRNPALTAMEIAALAAMHPGRLIVAFGHGVPSWMRQVGAYPRSQLAALEETLSIVRRLLAGENVTVHGKHAHVADVRLEFPPQVVPPVWAGVRGPKSLAVSGKAAQGTLLAEPAAPEYVRATRAIVGGGDHQLATYNWFALDEDHERALGRVHADVTATIQPGADPHFTPLPFGQALLDGAALRPEWTDQLSIAGPLSHCAGKVSALADAGCDSVILLPPEGDVVEEAFDAAGELARAVR